MAQSVSKAVIKMVTSPLVPSYHVILCFQSQSPSLINFSIPKGIELKFGGGVNSKTLISCFMPILSNKTNLIKITEFYCNFL